MRVRLRAMSGIRSAPAPGSSSWPTNEASFGETPSSDQFIAISRLRAAELGVDIVHAAVTGRSAIVHADGRIDGLTDLYVTADVRGSVTARDAGGTLYTRWGDWLQVVAMLAYIGLRARQKLESLRTSPGTQVERLSVQ